jgi:hypothetical protein
MPAQVNQPCGNCRCWRSRISASFRRRSLLRRGRTGRRRRAQLSPPRMINPPIISDSTPYQKPESGEGRRQPWPEHVGPLDAGTTRLIVAVWICVAGVRHVPFPFLASQRLSISKLLTVRNVPGHERRSDHFGHASRQQSHEGWGQGDRVVRVRITAAKRLAPKAAA